MPRKKNHPSSGRPVVVKAGGSLHNQIADLAPVFLASMHPLFIVPGGGIFADAVRKSGADNDSAHWMAIAAMDQYGWFIASRGLGTTTLLRVPDKPVVFLPYSSMLEHDPLPHSWDVTSDSIAAWVAGVLGLDLLLLKSTDGITMDGKLIDHTDRPVITDVVDPFFIPYVLQNRIQTMIINGSRIDRVEKFLRGETVPGTRIGTTF